MHDDELTIDASLVRSLVQVSLPELGDLAVEPVDASGSTNALFRLGDDLLARLPRQPGGSATVEKEARWLPHVASGLSTAVPELVAVGDPGFGYPEKWSVVRWIEGAAPSVPWDSSRHRSSEPLAADLAELVAELRQVPVPVEAHDDPALHSYRGGQLAEFADDFHELAEACRAIPDLGLDLDRARAIWTDAVAAERSLVESRSWYHGDLLAENLLLRDGRLAAALDFGGLAVGDPTVDLIVAWEVLDGAGRAEFRGLLDLDDATWAKSMGWALLIALITFPYYWQTMPSRCADRRAMAAAVLAEA
ncbi:aminoglycoside phosphotransferase family protein [Nocardioides soli]|nr:aminoglycoside phosphotransferase family protein [Nocardioides soli]